MEELQQAIITRRRAAMTAVKDAQLLDCAEFYRQYEKFIEWDHVDNLLDLNEGMVNLIYQGNDTTVAILFIDGQYNDWSYCN